MFFHAYTFCALKKKCILGKHFEGLVGIGRRGFKNKKTLHMATRTSIFRMKAVRKFGLAFWPWRRLNPKQAKLVAKMHKKLRNQTRNQDMKRKKSQFFHHIRAKKLMALLYGKLNTSYLVSLFKKATVKRGHSISNFLAALETRLDTILYRVQFTPTLQAARQLISHQKVCVNNVVLNKPGYILQPGDVVSIAPDAIAHVGQNIQKFLRADNTQSALRKVGLLDKFRARRRRRKPYFKRMRFPFSFRTKRVFARNKLLKRESQLKSTGNTHTQVGWEKTNPSKKMLFRIRMKMRLHMMKEKRQKRFKLFLKHTYDDNYVIETNLALKRPKRRTIRLRFQRTAKGMPVKTWVANVLKNMKKYTKTYTLRRKLKKMTLRLKKKTLGLKKKTIASKKKTLASKKKTKITLHQKKKAWKTPQAGVKQRRKKKRKKYPFRFVTKKVFYKPTHLEVNYHTLHIVYLFQPDSIYFPTKLELQHVAGAFKR